MSEQSWNYYEILEVSPQADQDSIYAAYQQAKKTFSLSNVEIFKVFSPQEAYEWLAAVEEAYSIIGHPNSRRDYDNEIKSIFESNLPRLELEMKNSPPPQKIDETQPLDEGFARTTNSVYSVDPKIEAQIEKQEIFDGLFLKKIREYKKIDLTDFSKITCIAIRHLYAIENNNFSVLPAPVFVRGYIIQYCRILGLNEEKVVRSFMSLLTNE